MPWRQAVPIDLDGQTTIVHVNRRPGDLRPVAIEGPTSLQEGAVATVWGEKFVLTKIRAYERRVEADLKPVAEIEAEQAEAEQRRQAELDAIQNGPPPDEPAAAPQPAPVWDTEIAPSEQNPEPVLPAEAPAAAGAGQPVPSSPASANPATQRRVPRTEMTHG